MPEVVVIGGGVIGLSIAYHLARLGCPDVAVLEKDGIGCGSTGKCAGGIRQQFSSEFNIRLSMESVGFFERFEEETGHTADFRQHGYLILATDEAEWQACKKNVSLQRSLGLAVSLVSAQETNEIVPPLNSNGILGATYCPSDGYADPYSVVQGFAAAARNRGVKIYEETEVSSLQAAGHSWKAATNRGTFEAPEVVIAAGPWAARVGAMASLDIPVFAHKRHIFVTVPTEHVSKDVPMVVDMHNGFWFRREGTALIFGMRNPDEPESFDTTVDWSFLSTAGEVARHRLPVLEHTGIARAWAGLHPDSPDYDAILGQVAGSDGLFLACGFSGHGFMHAPAVGRIMAEIIANGATSFDLSQVSLERFRTRNLSRENLVI